MSSANGLGAAAGFCSGRDASHSSNAGRKWSVNRARVNSSSSVSPVAYASSHRLKTCRSIDRAVSACARWVYASMRWVDARENAIDISPPHLLASNPLHAVSTAVTASSTTVTVSRNDLPPLPSAPSSATAGH